MSSPKAARKAAVLPGTVEMITGVIAAAIVTHPLTILVHVRRFGMPGAIGETAIFRRTLLRTALLGAGRLARRLHPRWGRSMGRNVAVADVPAGGVSLLAAAASLLRERGN